MEKIKLTDMEIADISSKVLELFYEYHDDRLEVPVKLYPIVKELILYWDEFRDRYRDQVHMFVERLFDDGYKTRDTIEAYLQSPSAVRLSKIDRKMIDAIMSGVSELEQDDMVKPTFIDLYIGHEGLNQIITEKYGAPIDEQSRASDI